MLRKVILTRLPTSDEGTFGQLITDSGWFCVTGELTWHNDAENTSCITANIVLCQYLWSEKHQRKVYHIVGIIMGYDDAGKPILQPLPDGRTEVEIHSANLMGDPSKGYVKQLLGCIALGQQVVIFPAGTLPGQTKDQRGVTGSFDDVLAFEQEMSNQDFELWIRWAEGAEPCPKSDAQ